MRFVAPGLACLSMACAMMALSPSSHAQAAGDPFQLTAGTVLLRGRIVGIFPDNSDSTITRIGGHITVSNSITPEVDISYFFTDHIAVEAEGGITHNALTASDTALGDIPIGKVWGAPILALLQYHLLPHARWNPYGGIGVAFLSYFNSQAAGGAVQQLSVSSEVGAAFQLGMDWQISGHWYGNIDLKKLLVGSNASVNNGAITESGHVSPIIIGLGIGYRF
jgi:outer membrane protein